MFGNDPAPPIRPSSPVVRRAAGTPEEIGPAGASLHVPAGRRGPGQHAWRPAPLVFALGGGAVALAVVALLMARGGGQPSGQTAGRLAERPGDAALATGQGDAVAAEPELASEAAGAAPPARGEPGLGGDRDQSPPTAPWQSMGAERAPTVDSRRAGYPVPLATAREADVRAQGAVAPPPEISGLEPSRTGIDPAAARATARAATARAHTARTATSPPSSDAGPSGPEGDVPVGATDVATAVPASASPVAASPAAPAPRPEMAARPAPLLPVAALAGTLGALGAILYARARRRARPRGGRS